MNRIIILERDKEELQEETTQNKADEPPTSLQRYNQNKEDE